MTTPTVAPVLFQLWHRPPGKRQRWRKAGRYSTRAEAVAAIGGRGDWRVEELREARLADAPSLAESAPALS